MSDDIAAECLQDGPNDPSEDHTRYQAVGLHLLRCKHPKRREVDTHVEAGGKHLGKDSKPEESAESKWRKEFKAAYGGLDRAQKELDILQREDSKAQLQYYSDPQKALAEQYTRKDINDKEAKIAAKKKEIDQIKQQIGDMEDALRKSGGDPGWAAP